ncbi:hypothetical protein ACIBI9_23740 [Nonomuraea sp. NPDC050451]|uniref:hypothetical protein n=1 Tax=Nonomuraea sp. NPDC050451 TaxID=3364364 RepID=UPI0037B0962F
MTLASAALLTLPLSGAAFADAKPQPAATVKAPQPTHSNPATPTVPQDQLAKGRDDARRFALKVSVDPDRVRAGDSYDVTIVAKGLRSGTAVVTSPEGKNYRVALSDGKATKTLTVPSKAKAGSKTVTVKVGNRTATASFDVVGPRPQRDERHRGHDGK